MISVIVDLSDLAVDVLSIHPSCMERSRSGSIRAYEILEYSTSATYCNDGFRDVLQAELRVNNQLS